MPNWCTTYLTIRVPTIQRDALLDALQGPSDWAMPSTQTPLMMGSYSKLSAHQRLALDGLMEGQDPFHKAQRKQWMERLKTNRKQTLGAPDWMPISREDLRFFWYKENRFISEDHHDSEVVLSLPKWAPWADQTLFHRYFPGVVDSDGFWTIKANDQTAYDSGRLGPIALHEHILGVKWPPSRITRSKPVDNANGTSRVLFTYRTPWEPIHTLGRILAPVLHTHQAQALLFWQEEDQHSGWAYIDPTRSINTQGTWPRTSFTIQTPDPEHPDETVWNWENIAMAKAAQKEANAPFKPLVKR